MPYVHLRTDRTLGKEELVELRRAIIENLAHHLSKSPDRCMIQIDAEQCVVLGDEGKCAFAEVRVRGRFDTAVSEAFAAAVKRDVAAQLGLETDRVYLHMLETQDGEIRSCFY